MRPLRKGRFVALAASVAIAAGALLQPVVNAHGDALQVGGLDLDEEVFWYGSTAEWSPVHSLPFVTSNPSVPRCEVPEHACQTFELSVDQPGARRLRVALDTLERDDGFEMRIESPDGVVTHVANPNAYSAEALLQNPSVGVWHIFVAPYSAEAAPVRFRAKLESAGYTPQPNEAGQLLPNLKVTRTWEFGFSAPLNPLNGPFLAPDDANPSTAGMPVEPVSCSPDEMLEDSVRRCLRYSFGLGNGGDGPFDVRWTADRTSMGHDVVQCVQKADGTVEAIAAGTGSFHSTHLHWHYDDVVFHRLQQVQADGSLTQVGAGKKIGYSPADQGLVDFEEFTQDRVGTSGSAGNCLPGSNNRLGLSRGWGDAYRYQRAGNYVGFDVNADGEYVVQTIADPMNMILETDDADNVFYTHIRVTGNAVDVLEQGYGDSPWDPNKSEVIQWWER